ncbi:MAG TPA: aldo/keto reductase [Cellvibrionaceae bacterium]
MQTLFTQQRRVGRTALSLPALGFGAAPIGNLYRAVSDTEAAAVISSALDAGMDYFDTAPHYGFGLSEQRLGQSVGREAVVSSKVGRLLQPIDPSERAPLRFGFAETPDLTPVFDYSYQGVMRSYQQSLQRLGRPIDVLYAHDLGELTHGAEDGHRWREFCEGGYRAMCELKERGEIQAIGLGVNETAVCARALDELSLDLLLLAGRYTLLEQGDSLALLSRCQRDEVSVVVGGPFNSGILATGVKGPGPFYYNYEPAPDIVLEKVKAIELVCEQYHVPLCAAALQFPLAHPQVASVIAGFASVQQVQQARAWMDMSINADFWQTLKVRGLIDQGAPVAAK